MQFTTTLVALSSIAFAAAAPRLLAGRGPEDTLYVTFWENGCGDTKVGTSSTFYVSTYAGIFLPFEHRSDIVSQGTNPDVASTAPEACEINGHYNWQSVQIRQPTGADKYSVDFFSGEGCNNPISTFSENGCYTRKEIQVCKMPETYTDFVHVPVEPEGQQVITFRAHLL